VLEIWWQFVVIGDEHSVRYQGRGCRACLSGLHHVLVLLFSTCFLPY